MGVNCRFSYSPLTRLHDQIHTHTHTHTHARQLPHITVLSKSDLVDEEELEHIPQFESASVFADNAMGMQAGTHTKNYRCTRIHQTAYSLTNPRAPINSYTHTRTRTHMRPPTTPHPHARARTHTHTHIHIHTQRPTRVS